jgi:cytosine deaminase
MTPQLPASDELAREPELVIQNASTLEGERVDIVIAGERIMALHHAGSFSPDASVETLDVAGGLCLPGFCDAHIHLDKAGSSAEDGAAGATLEESIALTHEFKMRYRNRDEELAERMETTARRVANSGTRTLRCVVDVDPLWGLTAFRASLLLRDRLRGIVEIAIVAFPQEGVDSDVTAMLRDAAEEGADVIGAHTDIDPDPVQHLERVSKIAADAGLPIEVHTDETATPSSFRLPLVLDVTAGLDVTLVHCLSLTTVPLDEQHRAADRIREADATVVVAPTIIKFGAKIAPVDILHTHGVRLGLGSDNLHDAFMPLGTGRMLDAVRLACLLGPLTSSAAVAWALNAATGDGAALVTKKPRGLAPGAPATLRCFSGTTGSALLRGDDAVVFELLDGRNVSKESSPT